MGTNCWFCGVALDTDYPVCGKAECQLHDRDLRDDLERTHRQWVWTGFRRAFVDRCKIDGNWSLRRAWRWFYTLKAVLCVLLRREGRPAGERYPEHVEVSQVFLNKLYAGWEGCWLVVGYGVFRNWWFDVDSDGEWNM